MFCFPRLENGLPTVCADTCVGRLRYMGVLLYDMDQVKAAASTPEKGEIYHSVLNIIQDPNDPAVIAAAREEGIPENWIQAAQNSPVYKMVKEWQIALPLHAEFREDRCLRRVLRPWGRVSSPHTSRSRRIS